MSPGRIQTLRITAFPEVQGYSEKISDLIKFQAIRKEISRSTPPLFKPVFRAKRLEIKKTDKTLSSFINMKFAYQFKLVS
jgi:hypothetical protein